MLAFGAIMQGMARAFYSGTTNALMYESLYALGKADRYHEISGKTSSMFQWALGLSATLGGIAAFHSMELAVWLSVIPQVLCFILCFFFEEPKHIERTKDSLIQTLAKAIREFKHNEQLRLISITDIISFSFGEAVHEFQAAFYKTLIPV
jgi:MFS family permease